MELNQQLLIDENLSLIEAMKIQDQSAKGILFVVNQAGQLQATLTDGDIRRGILKGNNLKALVKDVANYQPKFLVQEQQEEADYYLRKYSIIAVPIVDNVQNRKILAVRFLNEDNLEIVLNPNLNLPVVIMAGGLGTRLYPYTKILPKPLIPIGETPILERIINQFQKYGCDNFYLLVNHKKNMIKSYFNDLHQDYKLTFIDEEVPLGTGGGLSLLKGEIHETFILANCDILIKESFDKIVKFHQENKNVITIICSIKSFQIPYGIVNLDQNGDLASMQEKPQWHFFVNTGCYLVEPEIITALPQEKQDFPKIIQQQQLLGKKIGIYPISEDAWLDMGQLDELKRMEETLGIGMS